MKSDLFKRRVAIVSVCMPATGVQVDLDVAGDGRLAGELDDGFAKIGSAFVAPEAGMEDVNGFAVEGLEAIAEEALMVPDLLQEAFGGRVMLLAQAKSGAAFKTPLGVEVH